MATILQLIVSGAMLGGVYALMSIGLTLVFGVLRVVNFAHGEYMMLAMYAVFWLFATLSLDPYLSALLVLPAAYLFGVLTERLFLRPTLEAAHVVQVFVTLGISVFLQNVALLLWSADFRSVRVPYASTIIEFGPILLPASRLIAFTVAMLVALALGLVLKYTYMGMAIRATAQDRRCARLMGVDVDRVYSVTFATGSALVALAGILLMPLYPVNPFTGAEMILVAFVIVVMGGMGSILGAVVAGLLIGMVESLSAYWLGSEVKQLVYFIAFLLVLIAMPAGLFGKRGSEVMDVT